MTMSFKGMKVKRWGMDMVSDFERNFTSSPFIHKGLKRGHFRRRKDYGKNHI